MPAAEMISGTIIGDIRIAMIARRNGHVGLRQPDGSQRAECHRQKRCNRRNPDRIPEARVCQSSLVKEIAVVLQRITRRDRTAAFRV